MKKLLILTGLILFLGCSPQGGFAAFVVNQDAQSSGSKPGKSYSAEPCNFITTASGYSISSGQTGVPSYLKLVVTTEDNLQQQLGRTLAGQSGEVQIESRVYQLNNITVTLQSLDNNLARGNFNARIQGQTPPWEVVGSFDAVISH